MHASSIAQNKSQEEQPGARPGEARRDHSEAARRENSEQPGQPGARPGAARRDHSEATSVTHIGIYTVYIYDEEAYRANIAQYYPGEQGQPGARPKKKRNPLPFPVQKR